METLLNEIRPGWEDPVIHEKLRSLKTTESQKYTHGYNQTEEYFIELSQEFIIPSFPIHHDVRKQMPETIYIKAINQLVDNLLPVIPGFFSDLTYFFDPAEIHKICFYHLYRLQDQLYLYLMRLNIQYRPLESELLQKGTNDVTPVYKTRRLYLESDCIPLERVVFEQGKITAFILRQMISQTWIGETGKGYFVRGIWMDMDLTKFFSKLVVPEGKHIYPFYPFTCKYKTICMTILDPTSENRKRLLPYLHSLILVLQPDVEQIQQTLRDTSFSEDLPLFKELKQQIDGSLVKPWMNIQVIPYLNAYNQKEFRIVI